MCWKRAQKAHPMKERKKDLWSFSLYACIQFLNNQGRPRRCGIFIS